MKLMKPEMLIQQRHRLLTQQILAAVQSKGGMGLYGPTGCGKTNIVRKILSENGIPFAYYALHNSPLQVFEALYQNRDKVIVIDDTSHNKNPIVQALFKAALAADPVTGKKTLRINISESTKKREGISVSEFDFEGVLILISNHHDANSSAHAEAIDSRLHTYLMELSFAEKLHLINQFSKQPEKYGMTIEQMEPLINYLNKHLHPGCTKFDLRLFEKAVALVKAAPVEWEIGVDQLLEVDPRYSVIRTIIDMCNSVGAPKAERPKLFTHLTGLSRSSYFDLCKRFGVEDDGQQSGPGADDETRLAISRFLENSLRFKDAKAEEVQKSSETTMRTHVAIEQGDGKLDTVSSEGIQ